MRYLVLILSVLLLFSCKKKEVQKQSYDFPDIQKKDTLVAATLYGSSSYFIFKGQEMGFDYELCSRFAEDNGLILKIKVAKSNQEMINMLERKEVDLIACGLPITKENKRKMIFAENQYVNNQVLIQRASRKEITNVVDLIGKEIVVIKGSKYEERLKNLNEELGGGINIKSVEDSVSVDNLIEQVAMGKIYFTIAENDAALLNKTYFHNLDIKLDVSFNQRSAWAVRTNTPKLAKAINAWYASKVEKSHYKYLYDKYFVKAKYFGNRTIKVPKGAISPFDKLFKKHAKDLSWDWQLLAAICFEESRFDTTMVSWAGARGLMQLMPRTAGEYGLTPDNMTNPNDNVDAAVKYLKSLDKIFTKVTDKEERLKFILAAYNGGPSHVLDAIALAGKYGKKTDVWYGNVESSMLWLSNREYYNDPLVKSGYYRSGLAVRYVNDVLQTYERFKRRK